MKIAEAMGRSPIPQSYSDAVAARWKAGQNESREIEAFEKFQSEATGTIKRYVRKILRIDRDSQWILSFQGRQYWINHDTREGPEMCGPNIGFTVEHRGLMPSIKVDLAIGNVAALDHILTDCRAMMDAIDARLR